MLTEKDAARFWAKLDKTEGGCWLWTGWTTGEGYGRFDIGGPGKKKVLATHLALILGGKPRPDKPNDLALHGDTCVSTSCCNPDHLRWGTGKENADDRDRLKRRTARKGEAHWNAKLSAKDAVSIVNDSRNRNVVAEEYGITANMVSRIQNGRAWWHVTGIPKHRTK